MTDKKLFSGDASKEMWANINKIADKGGKAADATTDALYIMGCR